MKNTCPFYTVFKILKVLFKKMYLRYSRQLFCLFLIFFILISKNKLAFTISRSFFINFKEFHSTLFLFVTNYPFLITCSSSPFGYSKTNPKRSRRGGEEGSAWWHTFFKRPLKFLGFLLYPWKFHTKQSFTPGNSTKL